MLNTVLPARCCGCGVSPTPLCAVCAQALAARPVCDCSGIWALPDPEERIRAALRALKDHTRFAVLTPLGQAWERSVRAALRGHPGALVLLVPSRPRAVARRGFSPLRELARGIKVLPEQSAWLVRSLRDQRGLSAAERRRNVAGVFQVDPAVVAGRDIVLADDVATTGSTLAALAAAVRAAGGRPVGMAALISVQRGQTR